MIGRTVSSPIVQSTLHSPIFGSRLHRAFYPFDHVCQQDHNRLWLATARHTTCGGPGPEGGRTLIWIRRFGVVLSRGAAAASSRGRKPRVSMRMQIQPWKGGTTAVAFCATPL